ncbi:amino acid permease [Pseudomonas fluorescens]|uniref:amino acid permease n=1 Tax=Pseudomonas fluorescens TaxID=294 RepID=UPI0037FFF705
MGEVEKHGLHRDLKERHIRLIGLGTCIGVGLFLGSSAAIKLAGPAVMLAYLIAGLFIYVVMRALGEMCVHNPVAGSFSRYAHDYLGPMAGFITGWNYWFLWIVTCLAEITAVAIYMGVWFPTVDPWIWAISSLFVMTAINLLSVKVFGEFEFWFSLIKVVTIIGLIVVGLGMIIFGIGNSGQPLGISNLWSHGGFMPHGIFGVLLAFQMVTFAYGGIEIIGLTAGEAKNPKETIPQAIRSVPWRILLFYVGAIFVILSIYPWNAEGTGSPFVSTFEALGIKSAAGIINFVVITAALSSCNGGIYSTGRMLMNLTDQKQAPKFFGKTTKHGVPRRALLLTLVMLFLGVLLNYLAPAKVFIWLTAIAATGNITTWILILLAQIRFRRGLSKAEADASEFKMPGWPLTSYATLGFMFFVLGIMTYVEETRFCVMAGLGWLVYLAVVYWTLYRKKSNALAKVPN